MNSNKRLLLGVGLIAAILVIVLGVTFLQRQAAVQPQGTATPLPAGAIPVYVNGELMGGFSLDTMENVRPLQFTDTAEGKPQQGWLLRDALLQVLPARQLEAATAIQVSSRSRGKSVELIWAEVNDPANMVMFDVSNRGTLKLVSLLPKLDERDEWIQDLDRIDVQIPE